MGLREKEFIECFREMKCERHGAPISDDAVALLAVGRMLNRTLENCTSKICGEIEELTSAVNQIPE
jgi:hypothetical protein